LKLGNHERMTQPGPKPLLAERGFAGKEAGQGVLTELATTGLADSAPNSFKRKMTWTPAWINHPEALKT
jgi:hypothetical protein